MSVNCLDQVARLTPENGRCSNLLGQRVEDKTGDDSAALSACSTDSVRRTANMSREHFGRVEEGRPVANGLVTRIVNERASLNTQVCAKVEEELYGDTK